MMTNNKPAEVISPSIQNFVLSHRDNDNVAIVFEDQQWSYREYVQACGQLANLFLAQRDDGPFHVGVLLDNIPEYLITLGAAALAGAAVVGLNPTRRGAELARDIEHSDCQFLITEDRHLDDIADIGLSIDPAKQYNVDTTQWRSALDAQAEQALPNIDIDISQPYLLIFTSGTTGNPKAALCTQARLAGIAQAFNGMNSIDASYVAYASMPLFHSNALMANWAPMLAAGAKVVLRRKFSASGFLPDIRKYGCNFMNYVGKPLTYILATPERADDADNPLVIAFGNEAVVHDIKRFEARFNCQVRDNYGSTEGGINIMRTPETPKTALGVGQPGTVVLDPETSQPCAIAQFDSSGRLINADQAVGEIANIETVANFEGYWRNDEANQERTQRGIFWSGDLGYVDSEGFFYFGGRNYDWLRVDGENFAAAPIETIITRHEQIDIAAVYAVPNADVGDDVMATLLLRPNVNFDDLSIEAFFQVQSDLGKKSLPRYIRITNAMPTTASNKVVKRDLRAQGWECEDPVWVRDHNNTFKHIDDEFRQQIRQQFVARDRAELIDFVKS